LPQINLHKSEKLTMNRLHIPLTLLLVLIAVVLLSGAHTPAAAQGRDPLTAQVPLLVPEVLNTIPHDTSAYTQGLLFYQGRLFESTGLRGESSLREVDPATGEVLRSISIPAPYWAEGLAQVGDHLIQLTWQENIAFVYDLETFEQVGTFTYDTEGWGLCYDPDTDRLYMSDGSPFLFLRDPETFDLIFSGMVTYQGQYVRRLNELECVGDSIYANVWTADYIVQIDKWNGAVIGLIDATGLLTDEERATLRAQSSDNVLNGIAYNPETDTFLLTGKRWPNMFEVRFVPAPEE